MWMILKIRKRKYKISLCKSVSSRRVIRGSKGKGQGHKFVDWCHLQVFVPHNSLLTVLFTSSRLCKSGWTDAQTTKQTDGQIGKHRQRRSDIPYTLNNMPTTVRSGVIKKCYLRALRYCGTFACLFVLIFCFSYIASELMATKFAKTPICSNSLITWSMQSPTFEATAGGRYRHLYSILQNANCACPEGFGTAHPPRKQCYN